MASSEWRMGTPNELFAIRYWKGRRDGDRRRGDALGRSAAMHDSPLSSEQGLQNAQKTASYWLELASIWDGVTFTGVGAA